MQTYVSLFNFTKQGMDTIKEMPKGIEGAIERLGELGCKSVATYITMGDYDIVGIWQAPSDEVALGMLLEMGRWGNTRTTTLKAFTTDEFAAVVAALPEEEE